jgi:hypothetical protein
MLFSSNPGYQKTTLETSARRAPKDLAIESGALGATARPRETRAVR